MSIDAATCAEHVWVLAVVGEGRGRLDIASTCSVCGTLNDDTGPTTPARTPSAW